MFKTHIQHIFRVLHLTSNAMFSPKILCVRKNKWLLAIKSDWPTFFYTAINIFLQPYENDQNILIFHCKGDFLYVLLQLLKFISLKSVNLHFKSPFLHSDCIISQRLFLRDFCIVVTSNFVFALGTMTVNGMGGMVCSRSDH